MEQIQNELSEDFFAMLSYSKSLIKNSKQLTDDFWVYLDEFTTEEQDKLSEGIRSRAWVFTVNNYDKDSIPRIVDVFNARNGIYLIIGKEIGKKKKTPHLQGYIYFKFQTGFNFLKKSFPPCWMKPARGTAEQSRIYCSKEGNFVEHGEMPKQGKRTDLHELHELIKKKTSMCDLMQAQPGNVIRYMSNIEKARSYYLTKRDSQPIIQWVYGSTGVGKTRYAYELDPSVYFKEAGQWWNKYDQQKVIVFDDFNGDAHTPFRTLLRVTDRYPYQGQVKGGDVEINSPIMVITADRNPYDMYKGKLSLLELNQLLRRITKVIELGPDRTILREWSGPEFPTDNFEELKDDSKWTRHNFSLQNSNSCDDEFMSLDDSIFDSKLSKCNLPKSHKK